MDVKIIYLSSPYSSSDEKVREDRYIRACRAAARLMINEFVVFSPIAHSHAIAIHGELNSLDHKFWLKQDLPMLKRCDALYLLCLSGWEESEGVKVEIMLAHSLNMQVKPLIEDWSSELL